MFVAGSSDHWYWGEDAFPPIAFCVRVLVLDGLGVPPFDQHADGDGRLRRFGLDAASWREWVTSVIRQHAAIGEHARTLGTPYARGPLREEACAAAEVLRLPGSFCPGSAELRAQLDDLFSGYAPAGEDWKRRMSDGHRLHGSPRHQRDLWKALAPFHDRLAPLSVFLVEYDEPVVLPLPPMTCLIAPAADPEGYGRQLLEAATRLATFA